MGFRGKEKERRAKEEGRGKEGKKKWREGRKENLQFNGGKETFE